MHVLLGRLHNSLMLIEGYSVHQLRAFTFAGTASTDQRIAVVVLEPARVGAAPDVPLLPYMIRRKQLGDPLEDHEFREVFIQMSGALAALHRSV